MISLELTVFLFGIQTVLGIRPFNWGLSYYGDVFGTAIILGPIHLVIIDANKVLRAKKDEML
jgi:hypothetical protein